MLIRDLLLDRTRVPLLNKALSVSALRHKAIANNIANAETPGYRAIDAPAADFKRALARAIEEQRESTIGIFELKASGGVRPTAQGLAVRYEAARDAGILKSNGNNVDLEIEMGRMVRNGMLHNLSAALLAHQFGQLREAIGERVLS